MIKLAFIIVCIIETFSNFAVSIQSKSLIVHPFISVAYRTFGAGIMVFLWHVIRGISLKINFSEFKYLYSIAFFGMFLGPVLIYSAAQYVSGGVIAVCFSSGVFVSEVMLAVIRKKQPNYRIIISGLTGIAGIIVLFLDKLQNTNFGTSYTMGIALSILGVTFLSLSGIFIELGTKYRMPIPKLFMYCLFIGSAHTFLLCFIIGKNITFDFSSQYILSLGYLTFLSVLTSIFLSCYLCSKIGQSRTAYTTLVFVTTSMIASTFIEHWTWHLHNIIGFCLVLISLGIALKIKH